MKLLWSVRTDINNAYSNRVLQYSNKTGLVEFYLLTLFYMQIISYHYFIYICYLETDLFDLKKISSLCELWNMNTHYTWCGYGVMCKSSNGNPRKNIDNKLLIRYWECKTELQFRAVIPAPSSWMTLNFFYWIKKNHEFWEFLRSCLIVWRLLYSFWLSNSPSHQKTGGKT